MSLFTKFKVIYFAKFTNVKNFTDFDSVLFLLKVGPPFSISTKNCRSVIELRDHENEVSSVRLGIRFFHLGFNCQHKFLFSGYFNIHYTRFLTRFY